MSDELTPLPPDLLAMLAEEREAPGPSAELVSALWSQIDGGGAPPSEEGPGPAPPPLPRAPVLVGPVAGGLFALGIVLGAAGHAWLFAPEPEIRTLEREVIREVQVEVPVTRTVTITAPPRPATAQGRAQERIAPASARDARLAAERQWIERARAALARSRPKDAWDALLGHRKDFPVGRLSEERDALEIQVLVELGRQDEARRAANRFITRYPTSILRAGVEAAIKAP